MGGRFTVGQCAAVSRHQRARLVMDWAGPPAGGARDLRRQGLGLLFEQGGKCALGQAGGGSDGNLLQGSQVGVQTGPGVAEGASCHDLTPAGRQITDILECFRGKLSSGHALSFHGLAPNEGAKFSSLCRTVRLNRQSRSWPPALLVPPKRLTLLPGSTKLRN